MEVAGEGPITTKRSEQRSPRMTMVPFSSCMRMLPSSLCDGALLDWICSARADDMMPLEAMGAY
jgi:hypothetical protein